MSQLGHSRFEPNDAVAIATPAIFRNRRCEQGATNRITTNLTWRLCSIVAVIAHAAVVPVGAESPPRGANVRPIIEVAVGLGPPRDRIPPAAVVIAISSMAVPITVEVTATKGKVPIVR